MTNIQGIKETFSNGFTSGVELAVKWRGYVVQAMQNRNTAFGVFATANILFFAILSRGVRAAKATSLKAKVFTHVAMSLVTGGAVLGFNVLLSQLTKSPLTQKALLLITATAVVGRLVLGFVAERRQTQAQEERILKEALARGAALDIGRSYNELATIEASEAAEAAFTAKNKDFVDLFADFDEEEYLKEPAFIQEQITKFENALETEQTEIEVLEIVQQAEKNVQNQMQKVQDKVNKELAEKELVKQKPVENIVEPQNQQIGNTNNQPPVEPKVDEPKVDEPKVEQQDEAVQVKGDEEDTSENNDKVEATSLFGKVKGAVSWLYNAVTQEEDLA